MSRISNGNGDGLDTWDTGDDCCYADVPPNPPPLAPPSPAAPPMPLLRVSAAMSSQWGSNSADLCIDSDHWSSTSHCHTQWQDGGWGDNAQPWLTIQLAYPAQVETVEVWNRCGNYNQLVRLGWHQIRVGGVLCANNTAPAECGPFYSQCGGMEGDNVTVLLPRDGMLHLNRRAREHEREEAHRRHDGARERPELRHRAGAPRRG